MYKLGIDIGTTSIGWAVVELEKNNEKYIPTNLLDFGVRIFNNGLSQDTKPKSLAVIRRIAKGARRNRDRYLQRRKKLFDLLVKHNLMPKIREEQKQIELFNPYLCRMECATIDLHKSQLNTSNPLYILGRSLFAINQHRGFQSIAEDNTSSWDEANNLLRDKIKASNSNTLGEYLYKQLSAGQKVRFRGLVDNNGKLKKGKPFPNRQMYEEEISYIFQKQRQYFPELTFEIENEIKDLIINQRNLQKQPCGICIFDGQPNIQLAQIDFQKFRIVSEVNNLEIIYPQKMEFDRKKLIKALISCDKKLKTKDGIASYSSIKSFLGLDSECLFNFESKQIFVYKGKDKENKNIFEKVYKPLTREGIKCSETTYLLNKEIENFSQFTDDEKYNIIEILTDYSKFPEDRVKELENNYGIHISNIKVNELLNKLPRGYAKLSRGIINEILQNMIAENKRYDEAISEYFNSNSYHCLQKYQEENFKPLSELPHYFDIEQFKSYCGRDGRITNPTVHIALNQLCILVNEIIKEYGNPEFVGIEVARDLAQSESSKVKDDIKNSNNKKINDEARRKIISLGLSPSDYNIEKYKVWRNLCPFDEKRRIDIYDFSETPHPISMTELFTPEYEIEHILPFSKSSDDSFANKIITHRSYNGDKSEKLPVEYFSTEELEILRKRAGLIDSYRNNKNQKSTDYENKQSQKKKIEYKQTETWWRFLPQAMNIYESLSGGMNARDINDTRYITKLTNQYLNYITNNWKLNTVNTGVTTDLYRHHWNLLSVLPKDFNLWIPQKWQKDILSEKLTEIICFLHPDFGTSKEMQTILNTKINKIITDLIDGNPSSYNDIVNEFEIFINTQNNEVNDAELSDTSAVPEKLIKRNAFDTKTFKFDYINIENKTTEEIKENCYKIFYDLSSNLKDRAQHYHHAIDAIVCACLDKKLSSYPNTSGFRKEVYEGYSNFIKTNKIDDKPGLKKKFQNEIIANFLRKENITTPYKNFNITELKQRFCDMLISYKEETNKVKFIRKGILEGKDKSQISFTKYTKDTAYCICSNVLSDDDKIRLKTKNKIELKSISSMIPVFRNTEQTKIYWEMFDKYFIAKQHFLDGIISNDNFQKIKTAFEQTFSKDKAYKWSESDGNYETQIYSVNDKWKIEVINNFRVFYHLENKNGYALWHKIYPNAKKIMSLRINDIVKVNIKRDDDCKSFGELKKFINTRFSNHPDENNMDFYFKVKKMSNGIITLRPLHIAQSDNDTKIWSGRISTLQKYNIQKVYLNVLGREIKHNNQTQKDT